MTAPKKSRGWKVRIVVSGSLLHVVSRTEPVVWMASPDRIGSVDMEVLPGEGDTLGFVRWSDVSAVSWRSGDTD